MNVIEDYAELEEWCNDNYKRTENINGNVAFYLLDDTEQKLLEMQQYIDELEKCVASCKMTFEAIRAVNGSFNLDNLPCYGLIKQLSKESK